MPTVSLGLAQSIESLFERLPSWRDAGARLRRSSAPPVPKGTLSGIIEGEVIPRLLIAHRTPQERVLVAPAAARVRAGDVEHFAPALVAQETADLIPHVEALLARGVPVESVLVDLFVPAARLLGEGWEEDRWDFVDVTLGLWRLQQLVHAIAGDEGAPARPQESRRALLSVLPGEQHVFGLTIVEAFFRRSGWEATALIDPGEDEAQETVSLQHYDLFCLSIPSEADVALAPAFIASLRRRSRNPHLVVMVGGRAFQARPELAACVGADGTAADPRQAVLRAEVLVGAFATTTACC